MSNLNGWHERRAAPNTAHKDQSALKYADLVYTGQWFAPLKEATGVFVNTTQRAVTRGVRLKLYKGAISIAGRRPPHSFYREDYVTFGEDTIDDRKDALGFINLFSLPIKILALITEAGQGNETK